MRSSSTNLSGLALINDVVYRIRRIHSLYVKPQIDRVMDKAFERRAQKVSREAVKEAAEHVEESEAREKIDLAEIDG